MARAWSICFFLAALAGCSVPLVVVGMDAQQIQRVTDFELCHASNTLAETRGRQFPTIENEIARRGLTCGGATVETADTGTDMVMDESAMAPAARTSTTALSNVNMRAGPGTQHVVRRVLRAGEAVAVTRVLGTWCECMDGATTVYVSCAQLAPPTGGWARLASVQTLGQFATEGALSGFSSRIVFSRGDAVQPLNCNSPQQCQQTLLRRMQQLGAGPEATAFARRLDQLGTMGWAEEYRDFGQVDLVTVAYPFRANTNGAFLLVNGRPELIEVESYNASGAIERAPAYRAILARHPGAFLSTHIGFVRHERLANGGQRFVFSDSMGTCRACDRVAFIEFAFDFTAGGQFLGVSLLQVSDRPINSRASPGAAVQRQPPLANSADTNPA